MKTSIAIERYGIAKEKFIEMRHGPGAEGWIRANEARSDRYRRDPASMAAWNKRIKSEEFLYFAQNVEVGEILHYWQCSLTALRLPDGSFVEPGFTARELNEQYRCIAEVHRSFETADILRKIE